jgi:DNA-binding NtrC family response regulator
VFVAAKQRGSSPFDLVILDMSLSEEKDGLEIFEGIHALFPEQRAIVASGHALSERVERAMEQGLAWLAKPYTSDALALTVQTALAADARAAGF